MPSPRPAKGRLSVPTDGELVIFSGTKPGGRPRSVVAGLLGCVGALYDGVLGLTGCSGASVSVALGRSFGLRNPGERIPCGGATKLSGRDCPSAAISTNSRRYGRGNLQGARL